MSTENITMLLADMANAVYSSSHASVIDRRVTNPYNNTRGKIYEMMTENTGMNILDSGGAYGYSWENNRKNGFDKFPSAWAWFDFEDELEFVVNSTFHWLCKNLEHDQNLQNEFDRFDRKVDPEGKRSWLDTMEEFADNECEPSVTNTDGLDTCLDGIVQYVQFSRDGDTYILLSYHGGCDVRVGYTRPRAFKVPDIDMFVRDMTDSYSSCNCTNCDVIGNHVRHFHGGDEMTEDDGFPKYWKRDPADRRHARCERCGETVSFYISECLF